MREQQQLQVADLCLGESKHPQSEGKVSEKEMII
jgi:hypothetical protein